MNTRTYRWNRAVPPFWSVLLALFLTAGVGWAAESTAALPYMEPFDDYTDTRVHGRNAWQAQRAGDVQAQTAVVYAGARAAIVATNSLLWNRFDDPTATNVWIDFYARQAYPLDDTPPVLATNAAAVFYVDSSGYIRALSNTTWVVLDTVVPSNVWRRYTVNLDYVAARWSLYLADEVPNRLSTPVAEDLAFSSTSTNTHFRTFRVKN